MDNSRNDRSTKSGGERTERPQVTPEQLQQALKIASPFFTRANVELGPITDEDTLKAKTREFRGTSTRVGDKFVRTGWFEAKYQIDQLNAWGAVFPGVLASAISGRLHRNAAYVFLEYHNFRLAMDFKRGLELTGLTASAPKPDELQRGRGGVGNKKAEDLIAALNVLIAKDGTPASTKDEAERIRKTLDMWMNNKGDFNANTRRSKRNRRNQFQTVDKFFDGLFEADNEDAADEQRETLEAKMTRLESEKAQALANEDYEKAWQRQKEIVETRAALDALDEEDDDNVDDEREELEQQIASLRAEAKRMGETGEYESAAAKKSEADVLQAQLDATPANDVKTGNAKAELEQRIATMREEAKQLGASGDYAAAAAKKSEADVLQAQLDAPSASATVVATASTSRLAAVLAKLGELSAEDRSNVEAFVAKADAFVEKGSVSGSEGTGHNKLVAGLLSGELEPKRFMRKARTNTTNTSPGAAAQATPAS